MSKIYLALGAHCHQPVGNFDFVIEDAFKKSYTPFLETLENYKIKYNLHYTGYLWDWIIKKDKQFLKRLGKLNKNKQIEFFTGGYYEPILVNIPYADRIGQIKKLTYFIKRYFKQKPQGMWLAERAWEPSIASDIYDAGVRYVILDDFHFKCSGLSEDELTNYFNTEDKSKKISVFPISQKLRYLIPFKKVEEVMEFLKRQYETHPDTLIVYYDDGEKFGLWPETYEWVFKKRWLDRFFNELEKNNSWIETILLNDWIKTQKAKDNIYLPASSYFEMSEWSLPSQTGEMFEEFVKKIEKKKNFEKYKIFIRGGFFRNFLNIYKEVNLMQKRVFHLSKEVERQNIKKGKIIESLYKAEANDAYWHGVFGGVYLPHLRHSVYQNIIKLHYLIKKLPGNSSLIEEDDFDLDDYKEAFITNKNFIFGIKPETGGIIYEFSLRKKLFNLNNTLKRRKEAYHKNFVCKKTVEKNNSQGTKEEIKSIHNLKIEVDERIYNQIIEDKNPRYSNILYLTKEQDINIEKLNYQKIDYEFNDFTADYKYSIKSGIKVKYKGEANFNNIQIKKKQLIETDKITFIYGTNKLLKGYNAVIEFNFSFLSEKFKILKADKLTYSLDEDYILENIKQISIIDKIEKIKLNFRLKNIDKVIKYSCWTVTQSEKGVDWTYQQTSLNFITKSENLYKDRSSITIQPF